MSDSSLEPDLVSDEEMLPEYDFTGGDRGKHAQAYQQGHTVTIHQEDGSSLVQDFPIASLWGLCADLGTAPSAIEIDQIRQKEWANFPREDAG